MDPNTKNVYLNILGNVDAENIDTVANFRISERLLDILDKLDLTRSRNVAHATVEENEKGFLYVDGELKERLGPGRYAFWTVAQAVQIKIMNFAPQTREVTARVRTKDCIDIDVTLKGSYKMVDPEKVAKKTDFTDALDQALDSAIRDTAKMHRLEEIRTDSDIIRREARKRTEELGAKLTEVEVYVPTSKQEGKVILRPNKRRLREGYVLPLRRHAGSKYEALLLIPRDSQAFASTGETKEVYDPRMRRYVKWWQAYFGGQEGWVSGPFVEVAPILSWCEVKG